MYRQRVWNLVCLLCSLRIKSHSGAAERVSNHRDQGSTLTTPPRICAIVNTSLSITETLNRLKGGTFELPLWKLTTGGASPTDRFRSTIPRSQDPTKYLLFTFAVDHIMFCK
jgi:hypothetical protein